MTSTWTSTCVDEYQYMVTIESRRYVRATAVARVRVGAVGPRATAPHLATSRPTLQPYLSTGQHRHKIDQTNFRHVRRPAVLPSTVLHHVLPPTKYLDTWCVAVLRGGRGVVIPPAVGAPHSQSHRLQIINHNLRKASGVLLHASCRTTSTTTLHHVLPTPSPAPRPSA